MIHHSLIWTQLQLFTFLLTITPLKSQHCLLFPSTKLPVSLQSLEHLHTFLLNSKCIPKYLRTDSSFWKASRQPKALTAPSLPNFLTLWRPFLKQHLSHFIFFPPSSTCDKAQLFFSAMQAGNALCYTDKFSKQFKSTPLRLLIWKEGITNVPEKNERVKLDYHKAGNTETEKFQNLHYEQNIYFKQNLSISKIN